MDNNINNNNVPMFEKFVLLLNEDKPGSENERPLTARSSVENLEDIVNNTVGIGEGELLITRLGKLLMGKIRAHSSMEPELFTPDEILKKHPSSLAPVMYRIGTESFAKTSKSPFKLIECRNITKLASDWKPSLPDFLISLGHQVILVELKEAFGPYNDFVYAVLRQMNYDWKIRLPRSFFYPDDVCTVIATPDEQLILITPSMPDGEIEFSDHVRNSLQYDILMMLKSSCESAMENHLLMRDLRVGKFADTFDGVTSIRNVYRSLQERLKAGGEMSLGRSSEQLNLYMLSGAGDTILNAQALIDQCKELDEKQNDNNMTVAAAAGVVVKLDDGDGDGDGGDSHIGSNGFDLNPLQNENFTQMNMSSNYNGSEEGVDQKNVIEKIEITTTTTQ